MPYLLGLFHCGMCRVSKFGAMSKREGCKIDRIGLGWIGLGWAGVGGGGLVGSAIHSFKYIYLWICLMCINFILIEKINSQMKTFIFFLVPDEIRGRIC